MPIAIRRGIFIMKEELLISGGRCRLVWKGGATVFNINTLPPSSANFVGIVVGFLNVSKYTPPKPPPCRLVVL